MFKRSAVCQAIALALALPSLAAAAESDESYLDQVSVSGYLKNYVYDQRLKNLQPPYFLKPDATPWQVVTVTDG